MDSGGLYPPLLAVGLGANVIGMEKGEGHMPLELASTGSGPGQWEWWDSHMHVVPGDS